MTRSRLLLSRACLFGGLLSPAPRFPAVAASACRLLGERVWVETAPGDLRLVRQEGASGRPSRPVPERRRT